MINHILPLYSWGNGVVMLIVFAVICITLVAVLVNFMTSGKKKENSEE